MAFGTARRQLRPRVPLRHGEGDKQRVTALEGLAALSLDALSSVAYGPEAVVVALAAAGTGALGATLPIVLAIAVLLVVLTASYCQVIAAHPDGGGAYAVAKRDLGAGWSLLAAASLIVDYVLTVAVSLAAGAASLASAFPGLRPYLLEVCLGGLALLTAVNLRGIADSARALMVPAALFLASVFGVLAVGLGRAHPLAAVGAAEHPRPEQALGLLLVLKAFASGCSALTGVEAIANGVPAFREPRVVRARRAELMLGALLGVMLVGIALLIHHFHVRPRTGVTALAQLTAGAFGTGWLYAACNLAVTLALALAANTSFGGLPVLMGLLARDDRMPHLFALRAERPVYRYGVAALAVAAAVLLIAVDADTQRLIPLYAIGVFTGFTLSQAGLVRHWLRERGRGWRPRALLNGFGALLTSVATVVLLTTKFLEGAWVVVAVAVPLLMLMFSRVGHYYAEVRRELGEGLLPPRPDRHRPGLVIVPLGEVSRLAEHALRAALAFGDEVVAVAVKPGAESARALEESWTRWDPGVRLDILDSPHRSLVQPVLAYVRRAAAEGREIAVFIPEVEPRHRRYRLLQNQRGLLLAAVLRARCDVVVCMVPYRLKI